MNLKKLLVQGILWRSLYFASVLVVNIFISRFLQASGTGSLYYLSNVLALIQIVVSLSLEAGITFYASGRLINVHKLLWLSVSWSFIAAALVLAGSFIYLQYVKQSPPYDVIRYCFFTVCYVTGLLLTNYACVLFYVQNNFFLPNLILSLLNILFVLTLLFGSHSNDAKVVNTVTYRYFLVFFLQGLLLVIAFVAKNKSWQQFGIPGTAHLLKLARYSLTAFTGNLIFFLVYRIDYWFVHANPAVCSQSDLGNYIQVSKLGQLFLVLPQILASVIFPRSASGTNRQELNQSIMIITRLLARFFVFVALVIAVGGHWLFPFIFGDTFNNMQAPFLIILPGIFFLSVLVLLAAYFGGKGILRIGVMGNVAALIVMVVGDYFLVPVYGIIGAAIISTAAYFVNMLYSLLRFYKDYAISWTDFFKWKRSDYTWLVSLLKKEHSDAA